MLVVDLISKVINSMFILILILSIVSIPFCASLIEMMEDERVKRVLHILKYPFGAIIFVVIFLVMFGWAFVEILKIVLK